MTASFQAQLASGLLEIIAPPAEFYPDMSNLRQTFGDPADRIQWRSKQNLDYAYLMMYAKQRSTYYVQLEDDVLTKKNFVKTMKALLCFYTHIPRYAMMILCMHAILACCCVKFGPNRPQVVMQWQNMTVGEI